MRYAAMLHDIGKIEIDSCILNKEDPLTQQEWEVVRRHVTTGANLLKEVPSWKKPASSCSVTMRGMMAKGTPGDLKEIIFLWEPGSSPSPTLLIP